MLASGTTVQARAQYDTHDERVAEFGASLIPRMARDVSGDDVVGAAGRLAVTPGGAPGAEAQIPLPPRLTPAAPAPRHAPARTAPCRPDRRPTHREALFPVTALDLARLPHRSA